MYKNQTGLNEFVHLASLLVRVEEVAREWYGQHSGCGTRSYLRAPGRLASGVQLPWEVEDEMSYSCTRKCAPFEISLAVVCWLRERVRQSRGEILADAQRRLVILGPMAVNPFQGLRWLLHDHADRHQVHGSKIRPNYFTTAGE